MPHTHHVLHAREGLYYPTRYEDPDLVVIHATQGDMDRVHDDTYQPSAAGVAGYFRSPNARGSAHVTVDDEEVWRSVWDHETAFGAKGHNANGLHLELCGFSEWTTAEWKRHEPMLREGARMVATWMEAHDIPLQPASIGSGGRMRNGWHSHSGLPGNDHWDPGKGFPWTLFLGFVEEHMANRPERADSLNLVLNVPGRPRRAWIGWADAFPAVQWVARNGLRPGTTGAIAWRGEVWRTPREIVHVSRNLARRFGKAAA